MKRGEIYRTRERVSERGGKPGFYIVVSRNFIASHEDISTVICAPVYSEVLGLSTEVVLGPEDGLPHVSAVRCDFLTLLFKSSSPILSAPSHQSSSQNSIRPSLTPLNFRLLVTLFVHRIDPYRLSNCAANC